MSEYNIQMNKYNALNAGYDQLYPATKIANVDGLNTALQNKAAGGFGYGDSISYQFTGDSDGSKFDNAINAFLAEKKAGVFQIKFQSSPFLDTVGCVGTLWTFGDGKYAVLKGVSYFGELVQRTRYDGVWSPWEWVNPSMKIGVEYRTTERHLGKPVYTKAVDCGAWANGKTVTWNENHAVRPISYTACNNGSALPYGDSTTYIKIVDMTSIHLGGTTDPWGGSITVIIKYYKTTD